jgi:hypothetical protein
MAIGAPMLPSPMKPIPTPLSAEAGRRGDWRDDGSITPRALGVDPFLTIPLFIERVAERLREELGLTGYDPDREGDDL